jgi:hypothetical protein
MEENVWTGKPCTHEFYIPAGYEENDDLKILNESHVWCLDCKQYINLLSGERLEDQNLVHVDGEGFYVR